jgi:hypothetical protein
VKVVAIIALSVDGKFYANCRLAVKDRDQFYSFSGEGLTEEEAVASLNLEVTEKVRAARECQIQCGFKPVVLVADREYAKEVELDDV